MSSPNIVKQDSSHEEDSPTSNIYPKILRILFTLLTQVNGESWMKDKEVTGYMKVQEHAETKMVRFQHRLEKMVPKTE